MIELAVDPSTPAEVLLELARGADESVCRALALNPNTFLRRGLAANEQAPMTVLVALACDRDPQVRRMVAENPRTPSPAMCAKFLASPYPEIRAAAAKGGSVRIIERLASDRDRRVRESVAHLPCLSAATLEALSKERSIEMRRAVARNPNATMAILERLAFDPDPELRALVAAHENAPARVRAGRG